VKNTAATGKLIAPSATPPGRRGTMYSPQLAEEINRRTGGMVNVSTIRRVLEALESTEEQKALRADAERWRKWIVAAKAPTGYENGESSRAGK
jgi:hypothetical protein